jgi:dTDP-glucose 4,6-dehydratase
MDKVVLPKSMEGKTVLVAGAAGFVPSTLSEFYLNLGANVIGLDNFITGSESNIEILSKFKNFSFIKSDIINPLPEIKEKVDFIFSMASPASPIDFSEIPIEILRVNSEGTRHLLELAKDKNARFLEASTSEVYGDPEVHPQVEEYVGHVNPIGPRSCYDESKRYAESLTMNYNWKYGLETRIIRIFNTYGPRMRPNDGRVIPNFITQAMRGDDITIYGDGSQTRSYCFSTDLVEGIHRVMMSNDSSPFNVGNPDEYSVKDTAELIINVLNSKSKLSYHDLPKDDPKRRCPNISKLQKVSDFNPSIGFEEGIAKTAEYFRSLEK